MKRVCVWLIAMSVAVVPMTVFAQGTAAPKASAPAKAAAAGAARTITITAKDMPTANWDVKTIAAKPGESLHIVLKAVGTMPKMAMAHNFVLLKGGLTAKQIDDFVNESMMAAATNYIPAAKKNLVLANTTSMAGAGETTEVTFKAPTAPGTYTYLCTFPGHYLQGMKGTLTVGK